MGKYTNRNLLGPGDLRWSLAFTLGSWYPQRISFLFGNGWRKLSMLGSIRLSGLCTTQLLAEYSVDSQRPKLVVLLWTVRDRAKFLFCGLSEAAGGGFYGLTGAMEKTSHGNQGAANDLELAVDLDGATRQAPRYAP